MNELSSYSISHNESINKMDQKFVMQLIKDIESCIIAKGTIYTFGNGGSATTAEHFASDLALMNKRIKVKCSAISLNSQIGLFTAIANDVSYDEIFRYQIENVATSKDVFIGFSASGNSLNILNAIECANSFSRQTYCFLGFDGGKILQNKSVIPIYLKTPIGAYGLVENLHLILSHFVIDSLISNLLNKY